MAGVSPIHLQGLIASCKHHVQSMGLTLGSLGTEAPRLSSLVLDAQTYLPLGQLGPDTLQLLAENLFWLQREASSFFQPQFHRARQVGWDAEPAHSSHFGSSPLV